MELIATPNIQKMKKTDQTFAKYQTVFPYFSMFIAEVMRPAWYMKSHHCTAKGKRPAQKHNYLTKTQPLRKHETLDALVIFCVSSKGD